MRCANWRCCTPHPAQAPHTGKSVFGKGASAPDPGKGAAAVGAGGDVLALYEVSWSELNLRHWEGGAARVALRLRLGRGWLLPTLGDPHWEGSLALFSSPVTQCRGQFRSPSLGWQFELWDAKPWQVLSWGGKGH